MRHILFIAFVFLFWAKALGNTFYLDPINGDINNPGTIELPWPSFQEVIEAQYIQSFYYTNLPYDENTSQLISKNDNGFVSSGDTLFLLDGLHGQVILHGYVNPDEIYIIGMPFQEPTIEFVHLRTAKNWTFENINIYSEPYNHQSMNRLFYAESHGWQGPSSHISILSSNISSNSTPWTDSLSWLTHARSGIYLQGDSMLVQDNIISNVDMGITSLGDYHEVVGNMIDNFSGDGMRILGSYISFRNNTIKNCYDVDENHDDGIQSFTTNGYVVDHNEIIGNTIINTDDSLRPLVGPLQGIGCFDGFYNDWLVINNVINVNHWHGITFLGANNVRIINNTVIDPTPDITPGASWIRIADHKDGSPSSNCVVANNVANKFVIDAIDVNNFVLTDYEEYSSNFIDYSIADFRLLSTSSLIGVASLEYAPETDINGNLRLIDNIADVGAYEYMETSTVQEQSKVDIWVYPNPFSNELFIKSETVETVCVFTMNGVSLGCFLRENLNEQLHYLPVGFLLIQFQDKNGNVLESQIVIKER